MYKLVIVLFCSFSSIYAQTVSNSETDRYAIEMYKHFHQYPELGHKEFKTSERIRKELTTMGFTRFETVENLPTAVIAVLETNKKGTVSCFRADIDALPIHEESALDYSSKIDTTMHSCGHDAHTSILLALARFGMQHKKQLTGKIVFLFQPAEEIPGGAEDIVASGILDKLGVQQCFALHISTGMPLGEVAISKGYMLAGSNYFTIRLVGEPSHASKPFEGSNIPLVASQLVQELSAIPATKLNTASRPAVIAVTSINTFGSNAPNIISSGVEIKGTIRTFELIDSASQNAYSITTLIHQAVDKYCNNNIEKTVEIRKNNPPLYNNEQLFDATIPALQETFGKKLITSNYKGTGAEDFSFIAQKFPSLYFRLGIAANGYGLHGAHTPKFTVHPESIPVGIRLFTDILRHLHSKK